jgi:hypothetical protein
VKKNKTPWPTKDAMQQVYQQRLWGTNNTPFYSGEGSHETEITYPYINVVTDFLKTFTPYLTICDLGCGDFNIGKEIALFSTKYYAIDIVEELICFNKSHYSFENVEFLCLDIASDEIPNCQCVIIRQVLQHLSNDEIKKIVKKLQQFRYIILTEHLPEEPFDSNIDIISGQGIRLKKNSGVDIEASPFNFKASKKELLRSKHKNYKGVLVTTLYETNS